MPIEIFRLATISAVFGNCDVQVIGKIMFEFGGSDEGDGCALYVVFFPLARRRI
jgi:hypothetical protein